MKRIRLSSIALVLSLFVLAFSVSCPHNDNAVKGTAKLQTPQTVEGAMGVEVYSTVFTIQLSDGAKFLKLDKGLDVKSWFNPQVAGLSYRVERDVNEGADTVRIVVEGTPTEKSDASIVIIVPYEMKTVDENNKEVITPIIKNGTQNITVSDVKEGSKAMDTQSRYAIGDTPDKPVASLTTNLVISGQQGLPFSSAYSATVELSVGRFAALSSGSDVSSWFSPSFAPDLTYTLTNDVKKNSKKATITITGTPKEVSTSAIKITIPADCLIEKIATPVSVPAGGSAAYNITNAAASAVLKDKVTIDGTANTALTSKTFTIVLTGATFKNMAKGYDIGADSEWSINPNISGLNYLNARALDDDLQNELTIEVTGTPLVGSESALNITIPKSAIVLPKNRENEVKEVVVDTIGSIYEIKGPKAELVGDAFKIEGRQGVQIEPKEFTVSLTDIAFKELKVAELKNEIQNWFGASKLDGLEYELVADVPVNATEATFRISGKPKNTYTNLISLVIPKARFSGAASTLSDMAVDMKSSRYNITSLSASMTLSDNKIKGGKGLKMQEQTITITLDGDGAVFNPITKGDQDDIDGKDVTFISPLVDGVKYKLQYSSSESKTMTIKISGTPSATSESVFQILIPSSYIKDANEDVLVTTNNARYDIVDLSASLVDAKEITGKKGIKIADTSVTVQVNGATLTNITQKNFEDDLSLFMSPIVPGLTYALESDVKEGATTFTIKIGGTPTVQNSDLLSIKIPSKYIVNAGDDFKDIGVDVRNSKYNITESSAVVTENPSTITGVTSISKNTQSFKIKLTNETFALLSNADVTSWFENNTNVTGLKFTANATSGSDTATITISGAPTKVSSSAFIGTIPKSALQSTGAIDLTIDTQGMTYDIKALKLSTDTVTVAGSTGNVPLNNGNDDYYQFEIKFEDNLPETVSFKESAETALDTTWISSIVSGLTFTKQAVYSSDKSKLVIRVAGTPTEESGAAITITIPDASSVIENYSSSTKSVVVDTQGSRYAIAGLYAQLDNKVEVQGFKDKTLGDGVSFTVNLVNSTFNKALSAADSVADWFTISSGSKGGYQGLKYELLEALAVGATSAKIKIYGAPEVAIPGSTIVMVIPKDYLTNTTEDLRVDTRGSLYSIKEITATTAPVTINGTQNVSIDQKTIEITLGDGVQFKPITSSITWSNANNNASDAWLKVVDGLSYTLMQNSSASSTAQILVRGTPTQTISEPISISIPSSFIDGMRENAPSITVDTNGSEYAIDTLSASVETAVTVSATSNVAIGGNGYELTINLTGAKFNTLSRGSTEVANWLTTVPGLTYTLKNAIPNQALGDDNDQAVVVISGTPSQASTSAIGIEIPQKYIKDASKSLVVDAKQSSYDIVDVTASVENAKTVSGAKGIAISSQNIVVNLKGHKDITPKFQQISVNDDVKTWFKDNVIGLDYKVSAVSNSSFTVTISGTPSVASSRAISITIPSKYIASYSGADIVVDTKGSTHMIGDLAAELTSTDNTVVGSRYIAIASPKTIKIKVTGTEFNTNLDNTKVASWFNSTKVNGLTYTFAGLSESNTVASVTIGGTPTEVTNEKAMQIVIPKDHLVDADTSVVVNTNNAKYDIKEPTAAISSTQQITGYRDITFEQNYTFTLTLANAGFKALTSTDVKSWFTPSPQGLNFTLNALPKAGDTAVSITITGTPTTVINAEALKMNIPYTAINGADSGLGNLTVDTKNSSYTIKDWSLKSNEVIVKGTNSGVAITGNTFTITFDNSDLYFNSTAAIASLDGTWINPILGGLTFKKAQVVNASNKQLTISVSGIPTATSSAPISITIPNASTYIHGYKNDTATSVDVNTSGSKYDITSLYATLSDQAIVEGKQYLTLTSSQEKILEVNLQGDASFKNSLAKDVDVKTWFTANHKGLSYTIAEAVSAGAKTAKVKISGTPEVVLTEEGLSMIIPQSYLSGTAAALNVDTRGSYYTFTPITAQTNTQTVNGSMNTALKQKDITITLNGTTFTSRSTDIDVSSWFSHTVTGLNYTLKAKTGASTSATISITGTPTETWSAPIAITIKDNSLITGYKSDAPNITPDTNSSRYAISSITASLQSSKNIDATKDIRIADNNRVQYVINLTTDDANVSFKSITSGTSVKTWISGTKIDGLDYTIDGNPSGKKQATILVSGTPASVSTASFNITIPQTALNGDVQQDIPVDVGTSKYNIVDLTASSNSAIVSGSVGTKIDNRTITLTLNGAKFTTLTSSSEDNVRSWFTDPIVGLKYTRSVNTSQTGSITITISGTPDSLSTRAIEITIPKEAIANYDQTKSGVVVNTNSSKYAIGNLTASLSSKSDISATREISMTSRTMTVTLSGGAFNSVSSSALSADVSDWFTPTINGLSYKLASGISAGSSTAVITISGTPKATSSAVVQMEIPSSYIKDAINSVIVDTKGSAYNILEASATVNAKQTVSGVTNITLSDRDSFTITLTNATFNAITSVSDWFVPKIDGLTYTLAQSVSQGATSVSIKIAGRPTVESSETLSIRIPRDAIRNSSTAFTSLNVDTKDSVYAISSVAASIATSDKRITGVKNITPTSAQTFDISMTSAKFSAINLTDTTGARAWFTNAIEGLTYAISATANSSTATVTISGTPLVSTSESIGIRIPKNYVTLDGTGSTSTKDIVVDANGGVYSITTPTATISSNAAVIINGIRNTKITDQTLTIDLTNAEFKNSTVANVKDWFTKASQVNGLSYTFARTTNTRGVITISGTPTSESDAVIAIEIPYSQITNAASSLGTLSVDMKSSHYTIGGTAATVASNVSITGTKGITLQNKAQSFVINVSGALFKSVSNSTVTSWISNPNNLTFTGTTSSDGKSITITPSGVPSTASNATLVITIPTSALQGTVTEAIVVNTKGLVYNIDEVSARINSQLTVNGILNRTITTVSRTVSLSGNDVTLTGLSTSTVFGSTTYTQPIVKDVKYAITSVASNGKSFTFSISGTPGETSTSTLAITIPRSNIKDASSSYFPATVTVNTSNSTYNINEASATVTASGSTTDSATVSAIQNVTLKTAQLVQINLDSATFVAKSANADVSSWFPNRIDGFTYKLQSAITASSTVAVVQIEGTPRKESSDSVQVKLPVGSTSLAKELTANTNGSVYNITTASAKITSKVTITGSNGAEITKGAYAFNIQLTGVTFASVSTLDVSSWFSPTVSGLKYELTSSLQSGSTSATVVVYGTPTRASSAVIGLQIKNSALLGATNLGDLTVSALDSVYNIQDVSITFSKTVEVSGFTNVPLTTGANDFTMTLSGAGFAAIAANTDISDWFTSVKGVSFKTKTATTAGANTLSVAVSGTPTAGSTSHIYVTQANMKLDRSLTSSIVMDTKDSLYNIIDVTATFASKYTLNGAKNIQLSENTFTINVTGITFASITAGYDVTRWIKPEIPGVSFKVATATGTNSSSITIKPTGTPTAALVNSLWTVTIPQGSELPGYTRDLVVTTLGSLYNIYDTEAEVSATTHIVGTKDQILTPTDITINLKNGLRFVSMTTTTDLVSWFDPSLSVPGLSYRPKTAVSGGSTSMVVAVTGTPSISAERNAVKIVIPPNMVYYDNSSNKNKQSFSVDTKGSEYQIAVAVTTQALNLTVTADIEIEPQVFEIYLRGTELEALQSGEDITDWFSFSDVEEPSEPSESEGTN